MADTTDTVAAHPATAARAEVDAALAGLAGMTGDRLWTMPEAGPLGLRRDLEATAARLAALTLAVTREISERGAAESVGAAGTVAWLMGSLRMHPGAASQEVQLAQSLSSELMATGPRSRTGGSRRPRPPRSTGQCAHCRPRFPGRPAARGRRSCSSRPAGCARTTCAASAGTCCTRWTPTTGTASPSRRPTPSRRGRCSSSAAAAAAAPGASMAAWTRRRSRRSSRHSARCPRHDPARTAHPTRAPRPDAAPTACWSWSRSRLPPVTCPPRAASPPTCWSPSRWPPCKPALTTTRKATPTQGPKVGPTVALRVAPTEAAKPGAGCGPRSCPTAPRSPPKPPAGPPAARRSSPPCSARWARSSTSVVPPAPSRAGSAAPWSPATEAARSPAGDRPPAWCHGHHIRHWAHGGSTAIANLVLLCPAHHRAVHHHGWAVHVGQDGLPVFTPPRWVDPDQIPITRPWRRALDHLPLRT